LIAEEDVCDRTLVGAKAAATTANSRPRSGVDKAQLILPRFMWKNPYSEQYNLGIEQQFGDKTIFSLNYVGSASHHMDVGGY
jgi:hypothetical protein